MFLSIFVTNRFEICRFLEISEYFEEQHLRSRIAQCNRNITQILLSDFNFHYKILLTEPQRLAFAEFSLWIASGRIPLQSLDSGKHRCCDGKTQKLLIFINRALPITIRTI